VNTHRSFQEVIVADVSAITSALRNDTQFTATPPIRTYSLLMDIIFGQALFSDGDDHRRVQRIMHNTLASLTKPESSLLVFMKQEVERLLDNGANAETMDLVADFAAPLTDIILARVLGISVEPLLMQGADALADITSGYRCDAAPIFAMQERLTTLLGGRSHEYQSDTEYILTSMMLLAAGRVTARKTLADGTLLLLPQWSALSEQIEEQPSLVTRLVEQVLCVITPTSYVARWAKEDMHLTGGPVSEGQKVTFHLKQANEKVCPHVDLTDSRPVRHLAFGPPGDVHFCIGAALARAELRAAFLGLLTRFQSLHLTGEPTSHANSNIGGLTTLPVRFTVRERDRRNI